MELDLYVDTSRKGISMAVATGGQPMNARTMDESARVYEEIVNTEARGEILGESLDTLLTRVGATLDDVKRVMVTLGPGSFSGFAQDAAGKAPEMPAPAGVVAGKECAETAVVIRARTGFWYLRLNGEEFFIETPEVIARLKNAQVKNVVADSPAQEDEALKAVFAEIGASVTPDTGKPLDMWKPLFDCIRPSLIQEANYIQPSYFEKLKS